jgi:hypothetical protein
MSSRRLSEHKVDEGEDPLSMFGGGDDDGEDVVKKDNNNNVGNGKSPRSSITKTPKAPINKKISFSHKTYF